MKHIDTGPDAGKKLNIDKTIKLYLPVTDDINLGDIYELKEVNNGKSDFNSLQQ